MDYGKAINNLRVNRMKQGQQFFAEAVGISQTYLSLLETNKKRPAIKLLERIADYVEIPLPIIFWQTLTADDIKDDKLDVFNRLKQPTDEIIELFY